MSENGMNLILRLMALDKMSGVIRGAVTKSAGDFEKLRKKISGVSENFDKIGKKAMITGAAFLALSASGLKMAADFESQMSSVSTLIDTNVESVQTMNKAVLGIAKRTPVALNELTSALYDIRSAGMDASDQFVILEKSAQLAVAGMGTTKEAVNLVTTSINAWKLKGQEAQRVYNTIFSAVKYGKTTISELAQGFGGVTATVTGANIKFDEYIASVTALTTVGIPASQAHTMLKAAIAGMTRETKESRKILNQYGAKDFKDLVVKSGGLVGALQRVAKSVKGNDAAILQILGSTEAFSAAMSVCGATNEAYNNTLNAMRSNTASAIDEAYLKKLDTINSQLKRAQNFIQNISIDFSTALMPFVKRFLDITKLVMDKIDSLPDSVKKSMALTTAGLGIGLTAFGALSITAGFAVKSFGNALSAYRKIYLFMQDNKISIPKLNFRFSTKSLSGVLTPFILSLENLSKSSINAASAISKFRWKNITDCFKSIPSAVSNCTVSMINLSKNGIKNLITGFATLTKNVAVSTISFVKLSVAGIAKSLANLKNLIPVIKATSLSMLNCSRQAVSNMIAGFTALPGNIAKSTREMIRFIRIQALVVPRKITMNVRNFGASMRALALSLRGARAGMISFNIVAAANPIGLAVAGIIAGAFLIYKFWRPIAGFFRGLWRGIIEGTKPLHPIFNKIGQAVTPLVQWLHKLFAPINTAGKASEDFGYKVGKAIGGAITGIAKLIKKVWDLTQLINPLAWFFKGGKWAIEQVQKNSQSAKVSASVKKDGSHANGLPNVPYNGYIAELHEGERVLTKEENRTLNVKSLSTPEINLVYSPTITLGGSVNIEEFKKLLEKHKREIQEMLSLQARRKEARSYA